ncbi:MAG: recombinase RecA [Deltaproteobacteria bacterium]|nr:recombinase RecA [Deltaproteobacteria bacterium]
MYGAQMPTAARQSAADEAITRIRKLYGTGSILKMDEEHRPGETPVISSGCLSLDLALGTGGIPRGRVTEIYGPESSGKTTLTLHVIAEAQKAGGLCAFIDAEHALDISYAEKLGVDVGALYVSQPDHGEQALEIADHLVRSGAFDLIVVDSVAALTPKSEIEGEMGDNHVGLHARLMSQAMRKLTAAAARTGTACMFINQIRMKIGVTFGSPETTTGGQALKFYSSVRLDIRRIGSIKQGDSLIGNKTRIKVVKNKLAPPFRQAEVEIRFGEGICPRCDLIAKGVELDVLSRHGSWLRWGDVKLGQGREAARTWLAANPEQAAQVRSEVLVLAGLGPKEGKPMAEA